MPRCLLAFGITLLLMVCAPSYGQDMGKRFCFEFYDNIFNVEFDQSIIIDAPSTLSDTSIKQFYKDIDAGNYRNVVDSLIAYKEKRQLNDWLYYQLVRKVAQQVSPKAENYNRYTLYKWFLMAKSGYDARLALAGDKIIFYILNDEDISDIPFFMIDSKKYMTLNYHDFVNLDLHQN